jgi:hypothetical protein
MTLPVEIEEIWGYLREMMQSLNGVAISPHLGGIQGWTFEGDEVEIASWDSATLRKHNIQGLTFWFPDGSDIFVSWGDLSPPRHWISFSEARGEYAALEMVFGYLVRVVLQHFRGGDEDLLSFSFD